MSKCPTLAAAHAGEPSACGTDAVQARDARPQPAARRGLDGAAFRLNAMYTDADTPRPRRGREPALGRLAVARLRPGHADARHAAATRTSTRTTSPTTASPGCRDQHEPARRSTRTRRRRSTSSNFYGLDDRDYEKTEDRPRHGRRRARLRLARSRCATSCATAATTRDSVITAPRFVAATPAPTINRQLQSRDMTDTIAVEPGDRHGSRFRDRRRSQHALVAGLEPRPRGLGELPAHGPGGAARRPLRPESRATPYPGPITRTGAVNDGAADTAVGLYAFDTVKLGERWELTGGLRWDRFDVDYDSTAVDGRRHPVRAHRRHAELARRRRLQAAADGSVYAGFGTSFNPSAEGLSLARRHRRPRAREDAERRGRHASGTCSDAAAVADRRALPHREDQRAHARHQPRRPADGARGRAAGATASSSASTGSSSAAAGRVFAGYTYM